jgi:phage terminase small subunit
MVKTVTNKKTHTTGKPQIKINENKDDFLVLPEGSTIDLSVYDWENEKLTDAQKLFIIWYATPGTEYYHRAVKAARKAGYSPKGAHANAFKMRRDPKIVKFIRKIEDSVGRINLLDTAQRWLQEKIIRGDYNIKDFYDVVEYKDQYGNSQKRLVVKPLENLTFEQQLCLDGVDRKGQKGEILYIFPEREKIRDSLIAFALKQEDNENTDDEDETMEIIMERLTARQKSRKENDEISRMAGHIRLPKGEQMMEL